jgi:hypothetical protein
VFFNEAAAFDVRVEVDFLVCDQALDPEERLRKEIDRQEEKSVWLVFDFLMSSCISKTYVMFAVPDFHFT